MVQIAGRRRAADVGQQLAVEHAAPLRNVVEQGWGLGIGAGDGAPARIPAHDVEAIPAQGGQLAAPGAQGLDTRASRSARIDEQRAEAVPGGGETGHRQIDRRAGGDRPVQRYRHRRALQAVAAGSPRHRGPRWHRAGGEQQDQHRQHCAHGISLVGQMWPASRFPPTLRGVHYTL
ncbi:hypothetical protein GCM10009701_46410 [Mycolicibacterium murale]